MVNLLNISDDIICKKSCIKLHKFNDVYTGPCPDDTGLEIGPVRRCSKCGKLEGTDIYISDEFIKSVKEENTRFHNFAKKYTALIDAGLIDDATKVYNDYVKYNREKSIEKLKQTTSDENSNMNIT